MPRGQEPGDESSKSDEQSWRTAPRPQTLGERLTRPTHPVRGRPAATGARRSRSRAPRPKNRTPHRHRDPAGGAGVVCHRPGMPHGHNGRDCDVWLDEVTGETPRGRRSPGQGGLHEGHNLRTPAAAETRALCGVPSPGRTLRSAATGPRGCAGYRLMGSMVPLARWFPASSGVRPWCWRFAPGATRRLSGGLGWARPGGIQAGS